MSLEFPKSASGANVGSFREHDKNCTQISRHIGRIKNADQPGARRRLFQRHGGRSFRHSAVGLTVENAERKFEERPPDLPWVFAKVKATARESGIVGVPASTESAHMRQKGPTPRQADR